MTELVIVAVIFILFLCVCIGLLHSWRNRKRKYDVYRYSLWLKMSVAIFCSMPMLLIGISEYGSGRALGIDAWGVILLFTLLGGFLVTNVWVARYKIVGTELLAYEIFTLKRMEIGAICMIMKTTSGRATVYLVVDNQGKKIEIPTDRKSVV